MAGSERLKILIISQEFPYPLDHGGAIAQYYFLQHFHLEYDISLCTYAPASKVRTNLENLSRKLPGVKIYFFEKDKTEKKPNLADQFIQAVKRIRQLFFQQPAASRRAIDELNDASNCLQPDTAWIQFVSDHVMEHAYDLVQLEFIEGLSILPYLPSHTKTIYICHEIRTKRLDLLKISGKHARYKMQITEKMRKDEFSLMNHLNAVVVFTEEDKTYLNHLNVPVYVCPFGLPEELRIKTGPSPYFDKIIFIGKELFWPNLEGLTWFLDVIYLPNADQIPFPIHIMGNWSDQFKKKYHHKKVIFEGEVDDLHLFFENSMMVSPVLSGSGIRTKILHAYANYIPVLSTPFACEGLQYRDRQERNVLQFENSKEFEGLIHSIQNDPSILTEVSLNAHRFYMEKFGDQKLLAARRNIYEQVSGDSIINEA